MLFTAPCVILIEDEKNITRIFMDEKELFVRLGEKYVDKARTALLNSRRHCLEGHRRLEAEYQNTIYNLEHAIKEAKISRENIGEKATKKEILLADAAIEKAEQALKFGTIKARADLETGYLNLKIEVENKTIWLDQELICLEFAKDEQAKGFS